MPTGYAPRTGAGAPRRTALHKLAACGYGKTAPCKMPLARPVPSHINSRVGAPRMRRAALVAVLLTFLALAAAQVFAALSGRADTRCVRPGGGLVFLKSPPNDWSTFGT